MLTTHQWVADAKRHELYPVVFSHPNPDLRPPVVVVRHNAALLDCLAHDIM